MVRNGSSGGARARARAAVRLEVAAVAVELVLEQGYEATTVDDICTAAEISRSTFFRYFPSKEDALFGASSDAGDRLLDALTARPDDETPWVAVRRALDPLIEQYDAGDERVRRLAHLVVTTPALVAHHREKNARWMQLLLPELARRLGADPADAADPRPHAVIASALGCVEAALTAWTAGDHPQTLPALLDRAMRAVG
ncbi:MAG TPA: TetR family transcriptional regulator [Cellulomonas sp.]